MLFSTDPHHQTIPLIRRADADTVIFNTLAHTSHLRNGYDEGVRVQPFATRTYITPFFTLHLLRSESRSRQGLTSSFPEDAERTHEGASKLSSAPCALEALKSDLLLHDGMNALPLNDYVVVITFVYMVFDITI